MTTPTPHPAVFSDELLPVIRRLLDKHDAGRKILDPFAGTGKGVDYLRTQGYEAFGIELEPEWATQSRWTMTGNALDLPFGDSSFDAAVTSPPFANRMGDHHNARDKSHRRTYFHYLGRRLHEDNSGSAQWDEKYRRIQAAAWAEVHRVLVPSGLFVLNCKDHIRGGERQHVTNWHYQTLLSYGFSLIDIERVATPGYRYGANRGLRLPERLLVFRKKVSEHDTSMYSMTRQQEAA